MIYFTSDLHFYHKNIIKYSPAFRNYENADEMNEKLIALWNSVVTPEDTVYDLGDISMAANTKKIVEAAKRLNGKHFLIIGNHDYSIKSDKEKLMAMTKDDGNKMFEDIRDYKFITLPGAQIALSHYPMAGWENQQHGAIMLHGHLHDYMTNIRGKILNVGFDLHGKLLSLDDIIEFTKSLPTLPYRDEEDINFKALKDEPNIEKRKNLIKKQLNRVNNSITLYGCDLSGEIQKKFQYVANDIVNNIKSEGKMGRIDRLWCSGVTFELELNRVDKPYIYASFSFDGYEDDIILKTALYEELKKVIPMQYEIKISMEW